MLRYCTRCIMPHTKPDLQIDNQGVCSACRYYEARKEVNWTERRSELERVLERYRNKNGYDCIIGVSGGKDSTIQVLRMLEFGMHPLCVTASTDVLSDIGRVNLDNVKKTGR